jgi:hypothetical protein
MGVGGQRHVPAALPSERPGTHCIGGWVGRRAGLDKCGKSRLHRNLIPGPPSPYRVAIPAELFRPTITCPIHSNLVFLICATTSRCLYSSPLFLISSYFPYPLLYHWLSFLILSSLMYSVFSCQPQPQPMFHTHTLQLVSPPLYI